jgi:hypothetical protein
MNICNICCDDVNVDDYINCKVCNQKLFKCCYEKILKFDKKSYMRYCPYCNNKDNVNIDDISKPHLLNEIINLDKQVLTEIDENNLLRLYIIQIDEEREYLKKTNNNNNKTITELKTKIKNLEDTSRIYIKCHYDDKDNLKILGGKWDANRKLWYIENYNEKKETVLSKYKRINVC